MRQSMEFAFFNCAVQTGHFKMTEMLIQAGADVNVPNKMVATLL